MKKAILILVMLMTSAAVFCQVKTDSAKAKKVEPIKKGPVFRFDKNKVRNITVQLSATDIYLLSLTKYDWYELDHSNEQGVSPATVTGYHERYEELNKQFKMLGKALYDDDLRQFKADTSASNKPIKK